MNRRPDRRLSWLGWLLCLIAIAPAPDDKPAPPSALDQARYRAAVRQFDEVWTYYRQSRSESFPVYYWSRLVLDSQRALGPAPADRIAAAQGHLKRMQALETLVKKVRKLGFGFSIDVGASEYYRIEAEVWLAQASPRQP